MVDVILALLLAAALTALVLVARRLFILKGEHAALAERHNALNEKLETVTRDHAAMEQQSRDTFKTLARDILEENALRLRKESDTRLGEILAPLRENIESFRKTFNETYSAEARERFSLQKSLREMIDLNRSISKEAADLTRALRGNSKIQGDWGEMILETILEKSGLKRDIHFEVQKTTDASGQTLRDASGRGLRPDVVVNYPDGRCIVIDSKVSLSAYVDMVNAPTPNEAELSGRRHLQSVRAHIKELAEKGYQDFIGDRRADFVMMFIPNEGAYMAAMNLDADLWQDAYDKRVLIISPTHLISALRLIEQLWRQDDMKRNVLEIATESGKMYDKFVGFVDDLNRIGRALDSTQTAYDSAMKRLSTGSGNLVNRAERIRKMGAKTAKRLPDNLTALGQGEDTEE